LNAWSLRWQRDELLWCNPPFTDLNKVVKKVREDKARIIFVAPDWRSLDFFREMWKMASKWNYYPRGLSIFELDGEQMPPTRWGVWAVLLDGGLYKENREEQKFQGERRTPSSRRRFRRKALQ
jgi:hypothetical protein